MSERPIGVFDSGVGGLSILRELEAQLPREDLTYFADQAHVPYGPLPLGVVRQYSESIVRFLLELGAKMIVVACNTASAAALHHLRDTFPGLPFVGMEPAVKPAAESTQSRIVAVLATPATFQGELFASVVERFAQDVELIEVVLPGLVEQIELGKLQEPAAHQILERGLTRLHGTQVDTVVLACTHYPFVIPLIREILGPGVEVIDPSPAIARQAGRLLHSYDLAAKQRSAGSARFWTTGDPRALATAAHRLIGQQVEARAAVWEGDTLRGV